MNKVVITGPTGAIGTALVDEMIEQNIEVYCVCHKGSKRINKITQNSLVHIIECDLSELNSLTSIIHNKIDAFFHLAWFGGTYGKSRDDVSNNMINIKYTMDAIKVAKVLGCKSFIGAGSQSEYGNVNEVKTPNTLPNPESMYAASKLSSMYIGKLYAKQLGIRFNWCRIFSVFGPNDSENTMIMSSIKQMMRGGKSMFTKGEQLWDYIYSKDCALALRLIAENGKNDQIYNIASGDVRHLSDYIKSLHKLVNPKAIINIGAIPYFEHQAMNLTANIDPLLELGFKPNYTFEEGIKDLLSKIKF